MMSPHDDDDDVADYECKCERRARRSSQFIIRWMALQQPESRAQRRVCVSLSLCHAIIMMMMMLLLPVDEEEYVL